MEDGGIGADDPPEGGSGWVKEGWALPEKVSSTPVQDKCNRESAIPDATS